jgi:hypothetical protein
MFPQFYTTFSFENWTEWPVLRGLVTRNGENDETYFKITPTGQDFLRYLINNGLTDSKPG